MEAEDIGPFTQKGDEANKIKDLFIREQLLVAWPKFLLAIHIPPLTFQRYANTKKNVTVNVLTFFEFRNLWTIKLCI
jgi:hypothetical protein